MIYYFLPDPGIFGGVKIACQFLSMLISAGVRAVAVLPGGKAPQWFPTAVPVVSDCEARERLTCADWSMITWPPDYERLRSLPGRLICHCQGTDDLMHPIFEDASVPILSCWKQAAEYVKTHFNRETIEVGIAITDAFYYDGSHKQDNLIAYMPRRGYPFVRSCMRRCASQDFKPIDGLGETEVACRLKQAGIFLATAVGEQFGLPALEAMASGCLVISVPVKGGMEFLHDGINCIVTDPEEMPEQLNRIIRPENSGKRAMMRMNALATAQAYRMSLQMRLLNNLLQNELSSLKS